MIDHPPPPNIPGKKADGQLLHVLRREVSDLLERDSTKFPGAQPISFAARHLQELQERHYWVCEKSDGIRCLMYLTNDGDQEVTYLIDRKNDYYWVEHLHFPLPDSESAFYTGSLVDGELVNDRQPDGSVQLKYLVFDCLILSNVPLRHRTLDKRLAYYREKLYKPYEALYKKYPEELEYIPFVVEFKKMELAYGIEKVLKATLPALQHGNDGLIFTCVSTPYKFGSDLHILKWKPANENSVDFRLTLEIPSYELNSEDDDYDNTEPFVELDYAAMPIFRLSIAGDDGDDVEYGYMHVMPDEWEDLKALNKPLDEAIVECYQDSKHQWRFMRLRDDKDDANHMSTVASVIESIEDRIGEAELIAVAPKIREAWKAREAREVREPTDAVVARQLNGHSNGAGVVNGLHANGGAA